MMKKKIIPIATTGILVTGTALAMVSPVTSADNTKIIKEQSVEATKDVEVQKNQEEKNVENEKVTLGENVKLDSSALGNSLEESQKEDSKTTEEKTGEKDVYAVPYSTMYFESCNNGEIIDYIYKFIKIKPENPQAPLINALDEIINRMIEKLREIQMRIY